MVDLFTHSADLRAEKAQSTTHQSSHVADTGPAAFKPCGAGGGTIYEVDEDEDELELVAPNMLDPCLKKWVTLIHEDGRLLNGQVTALYRGSRSHEFLYEVMLSDGSEVRLTREQVIRGARQYQAYADSRT